MSLLGLELSDAGILVAASKPAGLLEIDGNSVESPGFAGTTHPVCTESR